MTEMDYAAKLAQADRLVNDPATPMDAAMVWRLMDEISGAGQDRAATGTTRRKSK